MRNWRLVGTLLFLCGVGVVLIGNSILATAATGHVSTQPPDHKVTLCHATDADSNPYVAITVDIASAGEAQTAKGHAAHTGPIWQPGDQANHVKWGDIIPPYSFFGFNFPGLNWTAEGMAILQNGCKVAPPASPTPSASSSPTPSQSPSPSASPSSSPSPSAATSPASPAGGPGGGVSAGSAPSTGETAGVPLAETGQNAAGWNVGLILIAFGLLIMIGGIVAWNRHPAV
jgi:hypothetical protein